MNLLFCAGIMSLGGIVADAVEVTTIFPDLSMCISLTIVHTVTYRQHIIVNSFPYKKSLDLSKLKAFADDNLLNPFPNKPWFLRFCSTSLLKTLWEKEKLLLTSNFSFSHTVFYSFKTFLPFSSNLKLLSANSFSLEESIICHLVKG